MDKWIREAIKAADVPRDLRLRKRGQDGVAFSWGVNRTVIVSGRVEDDGRRWLHLSIAHKKRLPRYEEVNTIRRAFAGEDRYSVMVWPPASLYVDIHPTALHIFVCWEADFSWLLPEFAGVFGEMRSI